MKLLMQYALAAFTVAIMASPNANAQFANTFYHMYGVPQANQLNPAFQSQCDGYVGMPFFSPFRFQFESSSFTYGDVFEWKDSLNKYITFLHPVGNRQKFLDALEPVNWIRTEFATSILSVGWKKEDWYFTLDFTERFIEGTSFSKDLAEFLVHGNLYAENFSFSDMGINLNLFNQLAIGASYNIEDEIQVGIRAKLLFGIANSTTDNDMMSLRTSLEEWQFSSDITANVSIPYLEDIPIDSAGYLDVHNLEDEEVFGFPEEDSTFSLSSLSPVWGFKNLGFAIDFGFNYSPIENLFISASVVDLGFIRWKDNVWNFHQDMDHTFEGLEYTLEDDWSPGDELLDSLKEELNVKVTQDPYNTNLSGKIYLGAAYNLTDRIRFGGVFRTRIQDFKFNNQFTVSANFRPISMFSASLSYSIYENSYMNLGYGLSMRAGPMNIYFVTDHIPSAYFWPESFKAFNFRLGLNVVWGCRAIPKAMKDRPLID